MSFLLMVHLSLVPRRRQKIAIDERLQRGLKRIPRVDRSIKSCFAKLDSAYKSHRAGRGSERKCKVGVLITLPDKGAQITARKAVLGDADPHSINFLMRIGFPR
jgi:hypothetical protein